MPISLRDKIDTRPYDYEKIELKRVFSFLNSGAQRLTYEAICNGITEGENI